MENDSTERRMEESRKGRQSPQSAAELIKHLKSMGNTNRKGKDEKKEKYSRDIEERQPYLSQFSLSSFMNDLSGRSFASATSHQSSYSVSRPWSRVSRRRLPQKKPLIEFVELDVANSLIVAHKYLPLLIKTLTRLLLTMLGTISKGAFGKVYKVRKKDTHEIYALKVLSKSKIISENALQQVKDEVSIQSMCGHNPFIVNCVFYWQSRKQLFIVSEYVPGGELLELCQKYGLLPEEVVKIYVAEIALALGIIYRDLKLENILLDREGHAQLIDFGLAKWLKYGCRTTTICGTRMYIGKNLLHHVQY
ncbi:Serine/threonine-protein kinase S6KL [Blattella germanica]|nr:Serine/threonine-protein kinase S6KL [Blattella germanica]